MSSDSVLDFQRKIGELPRSRSLGRVSAIRAGVVHVRGLGSSAGMGDRIEIHSPDSRPLRGEIVQIEDAHVTVLVDGALSGLSLGSLVYRHEPFRIAPCDSWVGRILDANAQPIDGKPLSQGSQKRALFASPPNPLKRRGFGSRLGTGVAALNTLLPIVVGQRIGLFSGSGVGKSSLLATLATSLDCDVCVIGLVGERGREVNQFTQQTLGESGMQRSVVVVATSDSSPLDRRRSAWTAMTIAEHFRDSGKSVLLLIDSITRFAEAHREIALAAGESPVLRGFPPSTAPLISELCERAGPGEINTGDITSVFSVLVAGSDFEEPVSDLLRGVLDGHVVLSREISERGRFPAIDILKSVSRSLPNAVSPDEAQVVSDIRKCISTYEENAILLQSGLYTQGNDAEIDLAIRMWPEVEKFLGEKGGAQPERDFDRLRVLMRRSGGKSP